LAVLKLAILVLGVLALAKLGFLDFITGGFDTGRFGGLPNFSQITKKKKPKKKILSLFFLRLFIFCVYFCYIPSKCEYDIKWIMKKVNGKVSYI
jgi:hypothetical protein